ncbi:MAG: dihydropteroate synthase [bacterium]|nr:dihydropteroate synthase [bacterium]
MEKRKEYSLLLHDRTIRLGARTCIMGILNVTPDSFSDGGKFLDPDMAIRRACQMVEEGADIIDLGAESTRPGSLPISAEEEIRRLAPIVSCLRKEIKIPLSIDTYKAAVAQAMLDEGAHLINDISGLRFDPQMAETVARFKAAVVLMHIQGTPRDMQQNPHYQHLIPEITDYLRGSIDLALRAGILPEQIIVDPGLGFGKTLSHNLEIIRRLDEFRCLDKPILIGPSRKSFIGKVLDLPVDERLEGTAAAVAAAIMMGAHLVRVHDVKAMVRVARIMDAILDPQQVAG